MHVEYEGSPAVDWYVQPGTPVYATMDGEATLLVNTISNAFDWYAVSREPYIGNLDRTQAPLNPFPGPGGGMGVWVTVANVEWRASYGHLDLARTLASLPADAVFEYGFSRDYDFASQYRQPREYTFGAAVISWQVKKGDVIGFTGDGGYSDAPHLHYALVDLRTGQSVCPTREAAE